MSKHEKTGLYVEVRGNNLDAAMRILQRKVKQENLLTDLAKHEFYEKPSVVKRREKKEAEKRAYKLKMIQIEEDNPNPNNHHKKKQVRKEHKVLPELNFRD